MSSVQPDELPVLIRRLRFGVTASHGASFSPEECAELLALVAPSQPQPSIAIESQGGSVQINEFAVVAQPQPGIPDPLRTAARHALEWFAGYPLGNAEFLYRELDAALHPAQPIAGILQAGGPPTPAEVMDALGGEVKATPEENAAFERALLKRSQPVVAQPNIPEARCECGKPLRPCPAKIDGEPAVVGFYRCACSQKGDHV